MRTDILAPNLGRVDLAKFMRAALDEAEQAHLAGELPIGAVLVTDGKILARGHARHQDNKNQLMHAELDVLLHGGQTLWERPREAILFTTLEPCPMCLGAAVMADVPHVIFALHDEGIHSRQIVATNPYVQRHIQSYYGGVLENEARALLARVNPTFLQYIMNAHSQ